MKKFCFFVLWAVAISMMTGCKLSERNPSIANADCLILGNIITMDDDNPDAAEAVVVSDGNIQYVGSRQEAQKYCNDKTQVLDFGKNSVYPGFMEGHVHGMEVATRTQQLDLSDLDEDLETEMQDFLDRIAEYVKNNPQMELYKGAGHKYNISLLNSHSKYFSYRLSYISQNILVFTMALMSCYSDTHNESINNILSLLLEYWQAIIDDSYK